MLKNILLLIIVLVLSYFTAEYFGSLYDKFTPLYDNTLGLGKGSLQSFIGTPFAYIFFLIITFKLFASGDKNKWIGWLLVPPSLFFASGDLKHIYLPIALALIAYGLTWLIQKLIKR